MELKSDTRPVHAPAEELYGFLTDFNHFEHLLPEQVSNWEASTNRCSFTIEGLPPITLTMGETKPNEMVTYLPDGHAPVDFSLTFHIEDNDEGGSRCTVTLNADLNPMLSMMAKRPLQNFVDLVAEKLEKRYSG